MPHTAEELARSAMSELSGITCEEYKKSKAEGQAHVFLDVREPAEWEAGHMDGAMHIPRGLLEFKVEEVIHDKDQSIILCCAKGSRAALAGQTLKNMGYTNLKVLEGGYNACH